MIPYPISDVYINKSNIVKSIDKCFSNLINHTSKSKNEKRPNATYKKEIHATKKFNEWISKIDYEDKVSNNLVSTNTHILS